MFIRGTNWGVPLAVLALIVSTAGCTGETRPVAHNTENEARALTQEERATIDKAEGVLTQRCMVREGFKIFLTEPREQSKDLPYGNDDVQFARTHGLGLGAPVTSEAKHDTPNGRYFTALSDAEQTAYLEALNGDTEHEVTVAVDGQQVSASTRGCTAEAQDELYGSFTDWFRVSLRVQALTQLAGKNVAEDTDFLAARGAWARCMKQRGHMASSPAALREEFTQSRRPRKETKAAVDEARCARQTKLTATGQRLEGKYSKYLYGTHRQLVTTYQTMSVTALQRALEITSQERG